MEFTPHNGTHAVQSTAMSVFFSSPLSRAPAREDFSDGGAVRKELPGIRPFQAFNFMIADGKATSQAAQNAGVEFFLSEPDGTNAWLLRSAPTHITVETRVYTKWKQVWPQAFEYLKEALAVAKQIAGEEPSLDRVEFAVLDRFETASPKYDLKQLFQSNRHVPPFAFEVGAAWHTHTGWYDSKPRVLNNLNFDTKPVVEGAEDGAWQIQIRHFQRLGLHDGERVVFEDIGRAFDHLHGVNADLIRSLLTEEMAVAVGLKKAKS